MKPFTYLLIDFFTLLIPFIFSFHPKLRFDKKWHYFLPAMIIVAIVFLVWDEVFTRLGVWGFNEDYLLGIQISSLPLEEILFFICIPYACVFTYHCFRQLDFNLIAEKFTPWITIFLIAGLCFVMFHHWDKYYTTTTFLLLTVTLIIRQWLANENLGAFYFSYLVLLLPFFITNGILTGSWVDEPIVWYNNHENMSIRLATIPVEDIFYGMLLILWNVSLMEFFERRRQSKISGKG